MSTLTLCRCPHSLCRYPYLHCTGVHTHCAGVHTYTVQVSTLTVQVSTLSLFRCPHSLCRCPHTVQVSTLTMQVSTLTLCRCPHSLCRCPHLHCAGVHDLAFVRKETVSVSGILNVKLKVHSISTRHHTGAEITLCADHLDVCMWIHAVSGCKAAWYLRGGPGRH